MNLTPYCFKSMTFFSKRSNKNCQITDLKKEERHLWRKLALNSLAEKENEILQFIVSD